MYMFVYIINCIYVSKGVQYRHRARQTAQQKGETSMRTLNSKVMSIANKLVAQGLQPGERHDQGVGTCKDASGDHQGGRGYIREEAESP